MKPKEGLGWDFRAWHEDGISSWYQFQLVGVHRAPHQGPRMWIEEWEFEKVIFCKQEWIEVDPTMVKAEPVPAHAIPGPSRAPDPTPIYAEAPWNHPNRIREEPPAKRQRMQSKDKQEGFV